MKFNIIIDLYTQNTMIPDKLNSKVKKYNPKTLKELIEYAQSSKWEFDSDKIDLYLLKFNDLNSEFDKIMELKPVPYEITDSNFKDDLYKIQFSNSDTSALFLPGSYEVFKLSDDGTTLTTIKVQDITLSDRILCRIFDSVVMSQNVYLIEKQGKYIINDLVTLDIPDGYNIPVGSSILQIILNTQQKDN